MKQLMKHTEAHANSLLWVGGARRCWNHVGASLDTWQAAAHCLLLLQLPPAVVWDRCAPGCAAPVPQTQGPGSVPRLRTRRVQLDSWEVPSTHTHTQVPDGWQHSATSCATSRRNGRCPRMQAAAMQAHLPPHLQASLPRGTSAPAAAGEGQGWTLRR